MKRYKLSIESLIRQRALRIIKDPRESLMLDEIIKLREENEALQAKVATRSRKKKESTNEGDTPSD